jgi:hypothetical protein
VGVQVPPLAAAGKHVWAHLKVSGFNGGWYRRAISVPINAACADGERLTKGEFDKVVVPDRRWLTVDFDNFQARAEVNAVDVVHRFLKAVVSFEKHDVAVLAFLTIRQVLAGCQGQRKRSYYDYSLHQGLRGVGNSMPFGSDRSASISR